MQPSAIERPQILVSYEWHLPRTAMTQYLAHLRPDLAFAELLPSELLEALASTPDVVVLCDVPTPAIEAHAKGWLVIPYHGPRTAVAGKGRQSRSFSSEHFDDVLGALDDLVAGRCAEPGRHGPTCATTCALVTAPSGG